MKIVEKETKLERDRTSRKEHKAIDEDWTKFIYGTQNHKAAFIQMILQVLDNDNAERLLDFNYSQEERRESNYPFRVAIRTL